jgi:UTP pyrophosphatase
LQDQVRRLIAQGKLETYLTQKYPAQHEVQTDKGLYQYALELKQTYLRNAPQPDKVRYDSKLDVAHHALGLNAAISRVQGGKLKAKKEIRIAALFKTAPAAFLRMIVVHELAHLKARDHDRSFYQLCVHMQPDYHQVEFDLRIYLTHLGL